MAHVPGAPRRGRKPLNQQIQTPTNNPGPDPTPTTRTNINTTSQQPKRTPQSSMFSTPSTGGYSPTLQQRMTPLGSATPSEDDASASLSAGQPLSQADRLRLWRHDALIQHHYQTAVYVGDKVLALTNDPNDAFWLAQAHYSNGNYIRARKLLENQQLDKSVSCRYLAALCLTKMKKWDEALELIGEKNPFINDDINLTPTNNNSNQIKNVDGGIKLESSMCYLRGNIYANQNILDRAKECYKEAIQIDIKCFEAFDQLISNNLLTPIEEWDLLQNLNFQKSDDNSDLIKALYTTKLNKYTNLSKYEEANILLNEEYGLGNNGDVQLSKANLLFTQCRFQQCANVCEEILKKDAYNFEVLPNLLACLYELGGKNRLFILAHELADNHPEKPITWLAVATYYLLIGKVSEARSFFSKASMMDPLFSPAWIGFAHTFAQEGEYEQAISAYSTAARLFPGSHLPTLFLGMQHLQMGNINLAEEYLQTSLHCCNTDPLILNELGVAQYHKHDLEKAESLFVQALKAARQLDSDPRSWLSIYSNLGHTYRRLEQYNKALKCFYYVLRISPKDANIFSALGLVYLNSGQIDEAVEKFSDVLALNPNDTIATDLLNRAMSRNTINLMKQSNLDKIYEKSMKEAENMHILLNRNNNGSNRNTVNLFDEESSDDEESMEIE